MSSEYGRQRNEEKHKWKILEEVLPYYLEKYRKVTIIKIPFYVLNITAISRLLGQLKKLPKIKF